MQQPKLYPLAQFEQQGWREIPQPASAPQPQSAIALGPGTSHEDTPNLPVEMPESESTVTSRPWRSVAAVVAAGAAIAATIHGTHSGGESKTAADALTAPQPSANATVAAQKPKNAALSSTASAQPVSPSAAPKVLLQPPADVVFSPPCTTIDVHYLNQGTQYPSYVPISWDYMRAKGSDTPADPNIAMGKVTGSLTLKACLPPDAIQFSKTASKPDLSVYTIDMTKATITPDPTESHLQTGIALNPAIDTDKELLASMQKVDPKATMANVIAFKKPLQDKANVAAVKNWVSLALFASLQEHYTAPILEAEQQDVVVALRQQLKSKGYRYTNQHVMFPPDITVPQHITLNTKQPSQKDLAGPFTAYPDQAKFSLVMTADGKQINPETQ